MSTTFFKLTEAYRLPAPSAKLRAIDLAGYESSHEYWVNPCSLFPPDDMGLNRFLHPTENVMGNWGGDFMIVGQDWAQVSEAKKNKSFMTENPDKWPFDKNTKKIFGNRGIMINACWMLKNSTGPTGKIQHTGAVKDIHSIVWRASLNRFKGKDVFISGLKTCQEINTFFKTGLKCSGVTDYFVTNTVGGKRFHLIPHLGSAGLMNFKQDKEGTPLKGNEAKFEYIRNFANQYLG